MTSRLRYWLVVLMFPAFSGCYPNGAEYTDEVDIVFTNYNNQFDFSSRKTYAIPDSVIKITGEAFTDPDGDRKPSYTSPVYAIPILDQIKQNMASYGWTKVDKNANPDMIILASTTTTLNLYYYYDWFYWNWWYPGWNPGWGWYYPGYYPPYITGYRSGSVLIQMIDQKSAISTGSIPVVWTCIMNGLAEGSSTNIVARIQKSISAGFQQSPYLKH